MHPHNRLIKQKMPSPPLIENDRLSEVRRTEVGDAPQNLPGLGCATASRTAPPRILVIDDSQTIREVLIIHLSRAGLEVHAVEDAVIGCQVLLNDPPDLVLCDILMPYLDGFELLKAVRADAPTRDLPVVFLTSLDDPESFHRARALGVSGYLVKPVNRDELVGEVSRCLERARHQVVRDGS